MTSKRVELSQIDGVLPNALGMFVACASYEDRCLSIANHLHCNVERAVILKNRNLDKSVSLNAERLCAESRVSKPVEIDSTDPLFTLQQLEMAFQLEDSSGDILVDITTFTHEQLLLVLRLLAVQRRPGHRVILAYTSASDYDPGVPETEKWLSKGVADVRSVLGYPGDMDPTKPTHLVVLVGFEHERASMLISLNYS